MQYEKPSDQECPRCRFKKMVWHVDAVFWREQGNVYVEVGRKVCKNCGYKGKTEEKTLRDYIEKVRPHE